MKFELKTILFDFIIMETDYYLPYEIIKDEQNDNEMINQYFYYDNLQNKTNTNNEDLYVGSNIDEVVNKFSYDNQKIKKRKKDNLIFNKQYLPKKEYFDNEKELKDNSFTLFIQSIENLKLYFYCLIIGIIIIILIYFINTCNK